MSNDVAVQSNTQMAIPQSLAALFAGKSNLVQHDATPSVNYKGKVWSINKDGNAKQLLDSDGNPLPMIEVVVLNANARRSRTYYEGKFVDGENKSPTCHSYLGDKPASDITEPQAATCEACPQSVKGSKVNDQGIAVMACSLRQRIVIVPSNQLNFTALLINMASTSAFDKENPEMAQGWFAWDQYKQELNKRGVPHTAAVKTKIRFSPSDAYPRLQFKFSGFLTEEEAAQVLPRVDSDEVMVLLNKEHGKAPREQVAIAAPKTQVAEEKPVTETPTPAAQEKAEAPKATRAKKPVQEPVQEAPKAKPVVVDDNEQLASVLSSWE